MEFEDSHPALLLQNRVAKGGLGASRVMIEFLVGLNVEIHRDKMTGYLLSRTSKAVFTIISQILNGSIIGTAHGEGTAVQVQDGKVIDNGVQSA